MLSDGGGLALHLTAAGSAVWLIRYRFAGKQKDYSAGIYPDVGLQAAREKRADVRAHVAAGIDPTQAKHEAKRRAIEAAMIGRDRTFKAVAERWLQKQQPDWSKIHYAKSRRAIERDVFEAFPSIAALDVDAITPGQIGLIVQAMVRRDVRETASRVLEHIGCVFDYARALDLRRGENPAAAARELLPKRPAVRRHPALLEVERLREILKECNRLAISPAIRQCNRLLAFTAIRPGNAVTAEWSEFNLDADAPARTIPRAKMKAKDREGDFIVYLAPTIVEEMREWRPMTSGRGFCFPSPTGKRPHVVIEALDHCIANAEVVRSALRRMVGGVLFDHLPANRNSLIGTSSRRPSTINVGRASRKRIIAPSGSRSGNASRCGGMRS